MRILAINGSPRKQGSTATVIAEMEKLALEAGHHVDRHDVYDLNISGCRGCMGCKRGDSCVIDDDMTQIYQEMKDADIIILGSPIYMGAETGPFKMLIDRTYALLEFSKEEGKSYSSRLPQNKMAFVFFPCNSAQGTMIYNYMNNRYGINIGMLGIKDMISTIVPGANDPDKILENPMILSVLEAFGERL